MLGFQGFSVRPFSTVTPFTATVLPVNTADTLTTSDLYAIIRTDWGPTQAETLLLLDAQTPRTDFLSTNAEVITLTDAPSSRTDFLSTAAETLVFLDSMIGAASVFTTTAETLTVADNQDAFRGFFVSRAETLSLADVEASQVNFNPSVTETLTLAAVEAAQAAFNPAIAEALLNTDFLIGTWNTYATTAEQFILIDGSIGRILWLLELEYAKKGQLTAITLPIDITVNAELYYDIKAI
jgi:hypothetical protein